MRKTGIALGLLLLLQGGLQAGSFPTADRVVVEKSARKLHLMQDGSPIRSFDIALGIRPEGDKQFEGDFRTPEGTYRLDLRNPNSEYFLSIRVSYPNRQDIREARAKGLDPGGAIMIHGQPNEPKRSEAFYRTQDWTNGCIAVTNSDMIDIWLMTADNTPIEIRP
jgi:murein L,D-transpeptidase YafK